VFGWIMLAVTIGLAIFGTLPLLALGATPVLIVMAFGTALALGALSLYAGAGLKRYRPWSRNLAIVVCVLYLLNFPVGTAVGAITLFFLVKGWREHALLPEQDDAPVSAVRPGGIANSKPGLKYAVLYVVVGAALAAVAVYVAGTFVHGDYGWKQFFERQIIFLSSTVVLGAGLIGISFLIPTSWAYPVRLAGCGAFAGLLLIPALGSAIGRIWQMTYVEWQFQQLCRDAHKNFGTPGERISGVLFTALSGAPFHGDFLLNQTTLDYLERERATAAVSSGPQFERLEVVGQRIRYGDPSGKRHTEYRITPIAEPSAPFEVVTWIAEFSKDKRVVISRVELRKRSDNAVLASARAYWHRDLRKDCPEGTSADPMFTARFLIEAIEMRR
jgi:hypothetical protein